MKSNHGEDKEDGEKTKEKVDEEQSVKSESREDGSNTKPPEFKGFQGRFERMKAARLQKMKDDMTRKEPSVSPDVDEEEVLRDAAKRTVEGIPGLMKEEKSGGGEEAGEGEMNEEIISQESGDVTERPKPPFKQYSDKGNSPSYHSLYTLPLSLFSTHRKSQLASSQ